ncbi:uncharacterized protein LOC6569542 [Drosophila grimshawi]|uniref:GH17787 n=1 Tax=Drosophila grimshawi TaxID=7222 RepID=B4JXR1_DROGR|nr:uncharacterized protein LOC6569542 [Drosophila grimshawi]EDV95160.1 GH17787 [Drosophila grimshawi]
MATTTSTGMLSTFGGFITCRNSQIQTRVACASPVSCCSRLQERKGFTTTATATTTKAVTRPRLGAQQSCSLMCPSNYWLLATMLIILTTCYLPNTAASPRRALGRHLILPHRHHVHLRSAGMEHGKEKVGFSCKHNMDVTVETLKHAEQVSNTTCRSIEELLMDWLDKEMKMTLQTAEERYSWHSLPIDYALMNESSSHSYNGSDTMKPEDELKNILSSLTKINLLLTRIIKELPLKSNRDIFNIFKEKLEHNITVAESMLGCKWIDVLPEPLTGGFPLAEYCIVRDAIRLLKVISVKYRVMHDRKSRANS